MGVSNRRCIVKLGFSVALLVLLAACSSNPSTDGGATVKTAQESDPSKGIICTYERTTDSFLKEKRCTTPEQREADRLMRGTLIDTRNERDSGIN
jgi:hypothetical protein